MKIKAIMRSLKFFCLFDRWQRFYLHKTGDWLQGCGQKFCMCAARPIQ